MGKLCYEMGSTALKMVNSVPNIGHIICIMTVHDLEKTLFSMKRNQTPQF